MLDNYLEEIATFFSKEEILILKEVISNVDFDASISMMDFLQTGVSVLL